MTLHVLLVTPKKKIQMKKPFEADFWSAQDRGGNAEFGEISQSMII